MDFEATSEEWGQCSHSILLKILFREKHVTGIEALSAHQLLLCFLSSPHHVSILHEEQSPHICFSISFQKYMHLFIDVFRMDTPLLGVLVLLSNNPFGEGSREILVSLQISPRSTC